VRSYLKHVRALVHLRPGSFGRSGHGAGEKPGDGLRQLARLVVDDNINLPGLRQYVQTILPERLIELSASARQIAARLPEQFNDLSPDDIAYLLRTWGKELDDE